MKAEITGNIGRIEARYTPKGTCVVNFSVAENREKDGKEFTNWYNITAWDKLAEAVNANCEKGTFVRVEAFKVESQAWLSEGHDKPASKVVFTASDVATWSGGKKVEGGHFVSVKETVPEEDAGAQETEEIPW